MLALLLSLLATPQAEEAAQATLYVRREGTQVRAALAIELAPSWHLYHGPTQADLGPPDAIGKPTTLTLEGAPVEWGAVRYPTPARSEQDVGLDEPSWIYTHSGRMVLRVDGKAAANADLAQLVAQVDGLVCSDETGLCVPYRERLRSSGPGPDALFAASEPPTARANAPPSAARSSTESAAQSATESAAADASTPQGELDGESGRSHSPGATPFLPSLGARAPGSPAAEQENPRAQLFVRATDGELRVAIELEVAPGWHVYHGPRPEDAGEYAQPTQVALSVEGGGEVRWSALVFPEPLRVETDLGGERTLSYEHAGTLVLRARGEAGTGQASALASRVRAKLSGQACSLETGLCVPFTRVLEPSGTGSDALFAPFADPSFAATSADAGGSDAGGSDARGSDARTWTPVEAGEAGEGGAGASLWLFLLAAVGWGLFTLLMPCTYPMIPITISFFTKQATQREKSALPLALAYGTGIVAIFVLIGVVVGPVIIRFATHPVTNLVIGGFFLVFALALFGAIELRPPAFLMSAAGKASRQGGYLGVFLMGATLVVTSFTCTAPFVGSLLSLGASQGGVGRIALGMAVFGLTMAIPFVLLSLLPGKLKAIPRSGEWMHALKVFLGFVEVAAALKFFSNSDIVWNQGPAWLPRELFLLLWAALFVAAALFLFGILRLEGEAGAGVGPKRMLGGLGSLLFAAYCAYGALGHPLDPIAAAIAPPPSAHAQGGAQSPLASASHTIVKDDFEAARALALREGKALLVNFTGYTCVNCRLMEEKVLPQAQVRAQLVDGWIEARLHTDGPPREDANRALQAELTRRSGELSVATPIYIGLDPQDLRVLGRQNGGLKPGEEPSRFVSFLERAHAALGAP